MKDLTHKIAQFFNGEDFAEHGDDARLEFTPSELRQICKLMDENAKLKRELEQALLKYYGKNDLGVDCISRADALRVAENEYLRGWHNALCKTLSEKYSIHCEEGEFSVIQEETITGLGLSMDCALGKDVESYMSTMPSVTPQEPILDKIRTEIEQRPYGIANDSVIQGMKHERAAILEIIDKYKAEREE